MQFSTLGRFMVACALMSTANRAFAQERQAPPPPRHTGAGRIYDQDTEFSIVPPKGWEKSPAGGGAFLVVSGPKTDTGTPNLNVRIADDDGTPVEKFSGQVKEALNKVLKDWKLIDESLLTIDGHKAYTISSHCFVPVKDQFIEVKILQYVIVGGNKKVYTITFATGPQQFDQMRKTYEQSGLTARVGARPGAEMPSARHTGAGRAFAGFSIVPPKGWEKVKSPAGAAMSFHGPLAQSTPNFNVRVVDYDGTPLDRIAAEVKNAMPKQFKDWKLLSEGQLTINGRQAFVLASQSEGLVTGPAIGMKTLSYFIVTDTKAYVLTFSAATAVFDQQRQSYEDSALSLWID